LFIRKFLSDAPFRGAFHAFDVAVQCYAVLLRNAAPIQLN